MENKKVFFSLFFMIFLVSGLFINNVNANSYYNHIQNPSFTINTNYIEDYGFESGEYNTGNVYGNFSGTFLFQDSNPHNGLYNAYLYPSDNAELWYNLTENYYVSGSDIEELSVYFTLSSGIRYIRVTIYYSDESYDLTDTDFSTTTVWTYWNLLEDITLNTAKMVSKIKINCEYGCNVGLDDFKMMVYDGNGQDEITTGSTPWFLGGDYPSYFGYINEELGYLDNTSVQLSGSSLTYKLIQDLNYIDSDYIQYIDCYIYGANVSLDEGIICSIVYSDRTEDSKTKYVIGDGSEWEHITFGLSWIDSDKYIIQIRFSLVESGNEFNIDDVGLWVSYSSGFTRFDFTVSPNPISISSFDFSVYSETIYTFNGYFYNVTSETLNENGTYQISDSFGVHVGNMINGFFSLQLSKRTYTGSPYTLETITVTIITDEEIFFVELSAYWYPVGGGEGGIDEDNFSSFMINFILYAIFFIAIPLMGALYINGEFAEKGNPQLGALSFIGMLTLMGAITLQIGFIDLWFMIVILVIDVLIILALLKGKNQ